MVFANSGQHLMLVAALQLGQLHTQARRQQTKPDLFLGFIAQPGDQGHPAADPALVPTQQFGDLHLTQTVFMTQRMHHQGLLHAADHAPGPVEMQHRRLAGPQAGLKAAGTEFLHRKTPGRAQPFEAIQQLELPRLKAHNHHRGQLTVAVHRGGYGPLRGGINNP